MRASEPRAANGEGGRELKYSTRGKRVLDPLAGGGAEAIRGAYDAWTGRSSFPLDRLNRFGREAERLASGEDVEAWTHPQSGAVVPTRDRARIFAEGLRHVEEGTSHSLRGGVMYAVAKHYREPPALAGTEHASVIACGIPAETPGQSRQQAGGASAPVRIGVLLGAEDGLSAGEAAVERWEREHPDEAATLREQVSRQLAAEVGMRQISPRTLQIMGHSQYRQLVLQRLAAASAGETSRRAREMLAKASPLDMRRTLDLAEEDGAGPLPGETGL
jgi:hypothetical protein